MDNQLDCQIADENGEVYFKVRAEAPLSTIFRAWSERNCVNMQTLCFRIERTSEFLTWFDSPLPIGGLIQNNDRLLVQ